MPAASPKDRIAVLGPWTRGLNQTSDPIILRGARGFDPISELQICKDVDIAADGSVGARHPLLYLFGASSSHAEDIYLGAADTENTGERGILVVSRDFSDNVPTIRGFEQAADWGTVTPWFDTELAAEGSTDNTPGSRSGSSASFVKAGRCVFACAGGRIVKVCPAADGNGLAIIKWGEDAYEQWSSANERFPEADITLGATGTLPRADVIAHFSAPNGRSYMIASWLNTIRWSFPWEGDSSSSYRTTKGPNDWHEDDWLTVGEDDGEPITAMVQVADLLLVFKRTSIWALRGNPEAWNAVQISNTLGTRRPQSVVEWPGGVAFWDLPTGTLWAYSGSGAPVNLWEHRIDPVSARALEILAGAAGFDVSISVGYFNNRLYCSLPVTERVGDEGTHTTYVLNTRTGSLSEYTYGASFWLSTDMFGFRQLVAGALEPYDEADKPSDHSTGVFVADDLSLFDREFPSGGSSSDYGKPVDFVPRLDRRGNVVLEEVATKPFIRTKGVRPATIADLQRWREVWLDVENETGEDLTLEYRLHGAGAVDESKPFKSLIVPQHDGRSATQGITMPAPRVEESQMLADFRLPELQRYASSAPHSRVGATLRIHRFTLMYWRSLRR